MIGISVRNQGFHVDQKLNTLLHFHFQFEFEPFKSQSPNQPYFTNDFHRSCHAMSFLGFSHSHQKVRRSFRTNK